ncbi:hypothetical protein [Streptomyces sp. NPDC017529]|uniref:hypothetical protein n=1 Tax=Streptomyces sp. NPDC017529 TaxID=3365000 RepID=UPI0037906861
MRPQRFQDFVVETLAKAPDVQHAEAWQEGTKRPYGVHVVFSSGAQLWAAAVCQMPPGHNFDEPEVPVTGEPPADGPVPDLYEGGKVSPLRAEAYLAAVLGNSGSAEIVRAYGYSDGATTTRPTAHPGVGVVFHSGGRGFLLFEHTARAGQSRGGRHSELQSAF